MMFVDVISGFSFYLTSKNLSETLSLQRFYGCNRCLYFASPISLYVLTLGTLGRQLSIEVDGGKLQWICNLKMKHSFKLHKE